MKQLYALFFLLSLAACTATVVDEPDTDAPAIAFRAPQAETRAAVDGTTLPGNFLVWGGYDNDATNVFNGTTVYKDAGWNYTDGIRYWVAGKTYNFYAVYPATGVTADVSKEGTITIEDFDCSATGEEAVDLMTAKATGIYYTQQDIPQPVGLTFGHLLCKVEVAVQVLDVGKTVSEVTFSGMALSGNYSSNNGWTSTDPPGNFSKDNLSIGFNNGHTDIFGGLLLIPDTRKLTFQVNTGNDETKTVSSQVTWQPGESYRYTIVINNKYINLQVEVRPWINDDVELE